MTRGFHPLLPRRPALHLTQRYTHPQDTHAPARVAERALIVSVGRDAAWLAFDDTGELRAAKIRKRAERLSLVPGDRVEARRQGDEAIVDRRLPRDSTIVRTTRGGRTRVMAANIDTIVIVAAFSDPPLHLPMVDEVLASAELQSLRATLAFTKPDLVSSGDRDATAALYGALGYPVFVLNPKALEGIPGFTRAIEGRRSLLLGQSGVGKSTLYRALGGAGATVGGLSRSGRGKQTTTSARLHRFERGFLIDSPGVGDFALTGLEPLQIAAGFREFAGFSGSCRFGDCTHSVEPDCAVREAAERAAIAPSRYASYREILALRA